MPTSDFGSLRHLAMRFFGALRPGGPGAADESWALGMLGSGEVELWRRMSGPDRRHAVEVARGVAGLLGDEPREAMAAALMHDVGKVESGLGTFARAGATAVALVTGRERLVRWGGSSARDGWRQRVGRYFSHDRIGAGLLAAAGSDALVVTWAGEHHRPEATWTVDSQLARALKDADGD